MGHISNRRFKEIRSLTRKKYRDRLGETLVEGVRAFESALQAGAVIRDVLVVEGMRRDARLRPMLEELGDRVSVVSQEEIEAVADVETSQGVVAVVAVNRVSNDVLAGFSRILVLDRLRDPGNAGTLIRSAAWFGVDAIATGRGTVDLYNPKVVRASMGGLWDVVHADVDDLGSTLQTLRADGFAVYGADMKGLSAGEWRPRLPSVLVLGSEAHGLSEEVSTCIDERVVIPGRPGRAGTESLNVAVAAGILMYEWTGLTG